MKRLWTDEEVAKLTELWKTKLSASKISEIIGRPKQAVYVKAFKLGLPKKEDPKTIHLTPDQKRWLKLNYPHMRTQICADYLGISLRSCVRWARRLCIDKTPEFMKECQAVTARLAKESQLRNGTYNPKGVVPENLKKGVAYQFKPGHIPTYRGGRKKGSKNKPKKELNQIQENE